jgi:cell wall-associated NlpC family hydrolase
MPFFQQFLPAGKLMCAAALAVGLMTTTAAWSADADMDSEPAAPISKLQHLGNRASELAMQAMGLLGIHYKYGGDTPEEGLDCSGFVRYIFQEAWGKTLPRTSRQISHVGKHVDKDHLQPGDLVFFNTLRRGFSHVGIYLGDSKFIHAPSTGNVVRIESMDISYWKKRFNGGRRISDPEQAH